MERKAEIYCPHCEWRPQPEDRWMCAHPCGAVWNTFWTRGVCPGCGVKWPQTQCNVCGEWAAHEAWYHYPPSAQKTASTGQEHVDSGT
jgi:hypothetical protein